MSHIVSILCFRVLQAVEVCRIVIVFYLRVQVLTCVLLTMQCFTSEQRMQMAVGDIELMEMTWYMKSELQVFGLLKVL